MKKPSHRRPPTSLDVARAAGVSRVTVSHVLNNTPGNVVGAATRARVMQMAEQLGYLPNASARALRRGHSDTLCVLVVGRLRNYFTSEWIGGMQTRARELGYALETFPYYLNFPAGKRKSLLADILARRPAALLGTISAVTRADVQLAAKRGVGACAVLGFEPQSFAPTSVMPVQQCAFLAGRHLIERGHRHIGFLSPRPMDPMHELGIPHNRHGLRLAIGAEDIQLSEIPVEDGLEGAQAAVDLLLRGTDRVTGIYGYSDSICFPFLRALMERGVRVPKDMALVGTEDDPLCSLFRPSITSVHYDIATLGSQMVTVVDALVRGRKPDPGWLVPPEPKLVVRESS